MSFADRESKGKRRPPPDGQLGLKPDDTFICELCGAEHPVGRAESESVAERERLYPNARDGDGYEWLMVCEACFAKHHPERN